MSMKRLRYCSFVTLTQISDGLTESVETDDVMTHHGDLKFVCLKVTFSHKEVKEQFLPIGCACLWHFYSTAINDTVNTQLCWDDLF